MAWVNLILEVGVRVIGTMGTVCLVGTLAQCTGFVGSQAYFANKPQPGALALTNLSATLVAGETRLSRGANNHAQLNCGNATHYAVVERTVAAADPAPVALADAELVAQDWQPCASSGTTMVTLDKSAAGRHVFDFYVLKMDTGEMARAEQLEVMRGTRVEIVDPTPRVLDSFGNDRYILPNGNILVGERSDDTVATNAGSLHIFDGVTGRRINTVYGLISGEALGTLNSTDGLTRTVVAGTNGNFLLKSNYYAANGAYKRCQLISSATGEVLFEDRDHADVATCDSLGGLQGARYLALTSSTYLEPGWLDVLDSSTGKIVETRREATTSGLSFTPKRVSADLYVVGAGNDIYLFNVNTGELRQLDATVAINGGRAASVGDGIFWIADGFATVSGHSQAGHLTFFTVAGQKLFTISGEAANEQLGVNNTTGTLLSTGDILVGNPRAASLGVATGRLVIYGQDGTVKLRIDGDDAGDNIGTGISESGAWPAAKPRQPYFETPFAQLVVYLRAYDSAGVEGIGETRVYDLNNLSAGPTVMNLANAGINNPTPYKLSDNLMVLGKSGASVGGLSSNGYWELYDFLSSGPHLLRGMQGSRNNSYYGTTSSGWSFTDLGGGRWSLLSEYDLDGSSVRRGLFEIFSGASVTPLVSKTGTGTTGLTNFRGEYVRQLAPDRCIFNFPANGTSGGLSLGGQVLLSDCAGGAVALIEGDDANDRLGDLGSETQGTTALSNGDFLVQTPYDTVGGNAYAGSVKWYSGRTGALVDSLVGTQVNDQMGFVANETPQGHALVGCHFAGNGALANAGRIWIMPRPQ